MKQFPKILVLIIMATILAACGEEVQLGASPVPATSAASTGSSIMPPTTGSSTVPASPSQLASGQPVIAASPTPVLPTASSGSSANVLAAVRNFSQNSSFNYQLRQQGDLTSGPSRIQFEAQGAGAWQQGVWRQSLATKLGGQTSTVEHFGRAGELFERVAELVVWRKLPQAISGPFPNPAKLGQANFQAAGTETLDGQVAQRFNQTIPAASLVQAGQPEILGALTASELYRPFAADSAATAQVSFWLVGDTQLVRYRVETTLKSGDSSLHYIATYNYRDFNATSIVVKVPDDLPRQ